MDPLPVLQWADGNYCKGIAFYIPFQTLQALTGTSPPFEDLCLSASAIRKSLSFSYCVLLDLSSQQDPPYLSKWERDLNTTFIEAQKHCILLFHHKPYLCVLLVPDFCGSRMFPGHSPSCWRCWAQDGTLFHIFWDCPNSQPFR